MTNVAYKTARGIPNLPDGFILEHFETEEDLEEGYTVVSKDSFSQLMANNSTLVQQQDQARGVVAAPPPPETPEPVVAKVPEAIDPAKKPQAASEDELFKQFLAWKNSQNT